MRINTLRFGDLEYGLEDLFRFPDGIKGLSREDRFILLKDKIQEPFMWLQSLNSTDLAFVVLDPWLVEPGYQIEITEDVKQRLQIQCEDQVMVLGIVVIPGEMEKMTINLRAPLILNLESRLGEQIILTDEGYDLRHPLFHS